MSERTKALFAMVDEFNRIHAEWAADPNRPNPDALYWEALDELVGVYREGDVPEECREMAEAVMELGLEGMAFDNRQDYNRQYPQQTFFAAREKLVRVRQGREKRSEPRPLESIDELNAQKVNPNQIARMHGIETWQVLKYLEKDKDGKRGWEFPADYVPPHLRDEQQRQKSARERYDSAMLRREKAEAAANPVAHEEIEELLQQGVSIKQIARMKRTTEVAVIEEATAKGIPLPKGMNLETIQRQAGQLDQTQVGVGLSPAPDATIDRPTDITAEILRLKDLNYEPQEIADALSISDVNQVVKVVKARHRRKRPGDDAIPITIPEKEDSPDPESRVAEVIT
jgi:hypothetical protein